MNISKVIVDQKDSSRRFSYFRRKLIKSGVWISPVMITTTLPRHAVASEIIVTVSTVWEGSVNVLSGEYYALTFDGIFGAWVPAISPIKDMIFNVEHSVNGDYFVNVGSVDWSVTGAKSGNQILGIHDTAATFKLIITSKTLKKSYTVNILVTRASQSDPSVYKADIETVVSN